jgi:hypothetical protein
MLQAGFQLAQARPGFKLETGFKLKSALPTCFSHLSSDCLPACLGTTFEQMGVQSERPSTAFEREGTAFEHFSFFSGRSKMNGQTVNYHSDGQETGSLRYLLRLMYCAT